MYTVARRKRGKKKEQCMVTHPPQKKRVVGACSESQRGRLMTFPRNERKEKKGQGRSCRRCGGSSPDGGKGSFLAVKERGAGRKVEKARYKTPSLIQLLKDLRKTQPLSARKNKKETSRDHTVQLDL